VKEDFETEGFIPSSLGADVPEIQDCFRTTQSQAHFAGLVLARDQLKWDR
jgi:hypothetical protein